MRIEVYTDDSGYDYDSPRHYRLTLQSLIDAQPRDEATALQLQAIWLMVWQGLRHYTNMYRWTGYNDAMKEIVRAASKAAGWLGEGYLTTMNDYYQDENIIARLN